MCLCVYVCVCVCVCCLSYRACNAHALYCHLWLGPFYNKFPLGLIKVTISEKTLFYTKCVFRFPLQRLSEIFPVLRRTELDIIKCILVFM